jgi:alcohol dehydrogenase class IV
MSRADRVGAPASFEFVHRGVDIRFGSGSIGTLAAFLDARGIRRAMIVCGASGAANGPLVEAILEAGGTRLAGIYDGATPDKLIGDVFDGIARADELGADALIGVGGGSSLDIARQISVHHAAGTSLSAMRDQAMAGTLAPPAESSPRLPVVVVPTTFAGACFSAGGTVEVLAAAEAPGGTAVRSGGAVWPVAAWYDPTLFATTPARIQRNSVMNGFNKGLETLYAPDATALTDAFAIHGVRLMRSGLLDLDDPLGDGLSSAVAGLVLVVIERRISLMHAFGQAMSACSPLQQGVSHAIFAPPVLREVFARVDGRRELFAAALGVPVDTEAADALAEQVVGEVERIRDALGLPGRLGEVLDPGGLDHEAFVGEVLARQKLLAGAPSGIVADAETVRAILDAAS